MLALLEAPEGATLAELMQVTGWQAHTTRAALTGLRKRGWSVAIAKLPRGDRIHLPQLCAGCAVMATTETNGGQAEGVWVSR